MKAGDIYRKFPNEVRGVILFLIIQIALIILKILGFMDINWMIVLLPVVIHLVIFIFLIAGKLCMVLLSPLWLFIAINDEKENKQIEETVKKHLEESRKIIQEHLRSEGNGRIRCKGGNFEILLDEDRESR